MTYYGYQSRQKSHIAPTTLWARFSHFFDPALGDRDISAESTVSRRSNVIQHPISGEMWSELRRRAHKTQMGWEKNILWNIFHCITNWFVLLHHDNDIFLNSVEKRNARPEQNSEIKRKGSVGCGKCSCWCAINGYPILSTLFTYLGMFCTAITPQSEFSVRIKAGSPLMPCGKSSN